MSDMGDDFRAMRKDEQERHAKKNIENTSVLKNSGLPFIYRGAECALEWKAIC